MILLSPPKHPILQMWYPVLQMRKPRLSEIKPLAQSPPLWEMGWRNSWGRAGFLVLLSWLLHRPPGTVTPAAPWGDPCHHPQGLAGCKPQKAPGPLLSVQALHKVAMCSGLGVAGLAPCTRLFLSTHTALKAKPLGGPSLGVSTERQSLCQDGTRTQMPESTSRGAPYQGLAGAAQGAEFKGRGKGGGERVGLPTPHAASTSLSSRSSGPPGRPSRRRRCEGDEHTF